jgi:hypothetical protein
MKLAMILASAFSMMIASSSTRGESRAESRPVPARNILPTLKADYVEARTTSVFAGPCHINGELMTTGNDALLAWRFENGVRIMAAVSCDQNLMHTDAARQSEIVIDSSDVKVGAKAAGDAALAAILSQDSASLGRVIAIRHAPINFSLKDREYVVTSPNFGSLDVQGLPDCDCCKQPNDVWYEPLVKVTNRMVGYTVTAEYTSAATGNSWQREDENGAFYGTASY